MSEAIWLLGGVLVGGIVVPIAFNFGIRIAELVDDIKLLRNSK